jgi:capsular exopolysaccharide synthesis family protein
MASAGDRVVIVDCDLRRPTQHQHLSVPREPGVTNYLMDDADDYARYTRPTEIPTLTVMACGPIPPNPPDLIGHPKFRALLAKLKADYDWVIIDSPPIATLADSVVLASMSDLMIMVIKHNQNDRDLIRRSLKRLRDIDVRIAGAVLNAVDLDQRYYGDYYYSGQGDDANRRGTRKGSRRDRDQAGRDSKKVAL